MKEWPLPSYVFPVVAALLSVSLTGSVQRNVSVFSLSSCEVFVRR